MIQLTPLSPTVIGTTFFTSKTSSNQIHDVTTNNQYKNVTTTARNKLLTLTEITAQNKLIASNSSDNSNNNNTIEHSDSSDEPMAIACRRIDNW